MQRYTYKEQLEQLAYLPSASLESKAVALGFLYLGDLITGSVGLDDEAPFLEEPERRFRFSSATEEKLDTDTFTTRPSDDNPID